MIVKPQFIKELRKENRIKKTVKTEILNPQIASPETIKKLKKVLENVVVKGTASKLRMQIIVGNLNGVTGTLNEKVVFEGDSLFLIDLVYLGYLPQNKWFQ